MKRKFKKIGIFLVVMLISLSAHTVHAELVGYWKFDEGTGPIAYDSSFYGNNGILEGGPKRVAGHQGGALELDGNNWLFIDTSPELVITQAITIACWIKPAKLDMDQGLVGLEAGYSFKAHDKGVRFTLPGVLDYSSTNITLEVGTWQHVAVTFQAGQYEGLAFYLNGVETEQITSSTMNPGTRPFLIGSNQWNEKYTGLIDDVCIYNHALDKNEIEKLYNSGRTSFIAKGYVAELATEFENIVKELKPKEAAALIENKIIEYEKWKARNLGDIKSCDKHLATDIYVLLARAQEAANAPIADVIETYRQSLSQPQAPSHYVPAALLWLYEKIPTDEYRNIVGKCIRNSNCPSDIIYHVAEHFQEKGNWRAFLLFLDAIFSETDDPASRARVTAKGLGENGIWINKFLEYCREKPELTKYLFLESEKVAKRYIDLKNFGKAAETYRNIINQCHPLQQKAMYQLQLSECLLNEGQFDNVIYETSILLKDSETTNEVLTCGALVVRGQAYVHSGDIDRAIDTFLKLMIEHAKAKEAPEACFFVGYCYMLQNRYDEAADAFKIVAKDYPDSEYSDKAVSYLDRIGKMNKIMEQEK
jgi:tetratricopeptide (TPR) repeat protein